MDIIRLSISKPVGVTVAVLIVTLFGLIGLGAIPIQLTPTVDRPIITVTTQWTGRSPEEIVDQITKEQEEQLKSVSNLQVMRSTTSQGQAEITLEFDVGVDIQRALSDVDDALRQVPDYPEDVDQPTRSASTGDESNPIAWIIIDLDEEGQRQYPDFDPASLFFALDKEVKPALERSQGVAEVNIFGGRDREVRILVDHTRLAQLNLTYGDLADALRSENINVSAGTIEQSKRDYPVRLLGQFNSEDDVLDTIIEYRDTGPITVRDVADVEIGLEKRRAFVRSMQNKAIAVNAVRESGSNVVAVMNSLKTQLEDVRENVLPFIHPDPELAKHLRIRQVYDETIYINSSIDLVTENIIFGGIIAAIVLLIFLRSFVATGIIALAIPISVVGTFLALLAMGRSLNVISLAGLAFAVGMVVDNAIVVLENIVRHKAMGKTAMKAAYDGGKEVWGAILASTLTTIAVFVPVLTIQEEAGQLFRDISLAVVAAVSASLIISITVIPTAASRWLGDHKEHTNPLARAWDSAFGLAPLFGSLSRASASMLRWLMSGWRGFTIRPLVVLVITAASLLASAMLAPPQDYLPAGNRNLIFGGLLVPPGFSTEQMETMAHRIEQVVGPYLVDPYTTTEEGKQAELDRINNLPPIQRGPATDSVTGEMIFGEDGTPVMAEPFEPLPIENFFIASFGGTMFTGVVSADPNVVKPGATLLTQGMNTSPDVYGGASQASLFGRGFGGGNSIDIQISGLDEAKVKRAAEALYNRLGQSPDYGYADLRPNPANFNLPQQEFRTKLNRAGVELGLRTDTIGTAIRALFDGAFVGDFYQGANTVDIRLLPEGGRLDSFDQLADVSIRTPAGPTVPLDTVLDLEPGLAPQSILRIEELPSVEISYSVPGGKPIETIMADIRENYLLPLQEQDVIDSSMRVRLEGSAADLEKVQLALFGPIDFSRPFDLKGVAAVLLPFVIAGGLCFVAAVRIGRRSAGNAIYAIAGLVTIAAIVALVGTLAVWQPELILARMVWALLVTYLLMCALFESFLYPFVIMITVPLAIVGGFLGLSIIHHISASNPLINPQNLDVLTMLGFVILIGVVVNNAILIVHQSLNLMRDKAEVASDAREEDLTEEGTLKPIPAIAEAVRTRIRPVFMSTLTSVGGMLPLVLSFGAGSELYRGIGAVVVGGLLLSTFFTLLITPLLLSLTLDMVAGIKMAFAKRETTPQQSRPDQPSRPARKSEPAPVPAGV